MSFLPSRGAVLLAACLTALAAAAPAGAQDGARRVTLTGRVVDQTTGQPLSAAQVSLQGIRRTAVTDPEGRFRITAVPAGAWRATVYRLGYVEAEVSWQAAEGAEPFHVALAPNPELMEELKVHVDRYARRRNAVATSVRVLSQDDMAATSASTAYDLVRNRGVTPTSCPGGTLDFGGSCIWHRGRPAQASVMVDERLSLGGLDELRMYRPEELFMVEIYGGGRHIRIYTNWYMEMAVERKIRPRPVLFY
jgi:hypothetical protein